MMAASYGGDKGTGTSRKESVFDFRVGYHIF